MQERNIDDRARLHEMLETAQKIHEILARWSRAVYDEDEVYRLALRYLSLIISDAGSQVSQRYKALYPEIPWAQFTNIRKQPVGEYSSSDVDIPWLAETENASQLALQLARILREQFGTDIKPFSLDLHLDEICAYCETQPIEYLSEFAPGFEGWVRPYTDIGLLVEYVPDASIGLLDMAGHEIDLGEIMGERVSLYTEKGLRQGPHPVPFDIGKRLYKRKV